MIGSIPFHCQCCAGDRRRVRVQKTHFERDSSDSAACSLTACLACRSTVGKLRDIYFILVCCMRMQMEETVEWRGPQARLSTPVQQETPRRSSVAFFCYTGWPLARSQCSGVLYYSFTVILIPKLASRINCFTHQALQKQS